MELNNAPEIAAALTTEGRAFLLDLCGIAGNGYRTAEKLAYYRSDLYTWYDAADLMDRYTKSQIGGFLSNLHALGVVDGKGREAGITELGVEVAILIAP
jgi:hypothetical protein